MKQTMSRTTDLLLICFLLLFCLSSRATATPPPCPDCYYWDYGEAGCVPYGDCWGGCPSCESCVNCYCHCTSECCEDSHCGQDNCKDCIDCECVYQCDPAKCETCVDGSCKVCGGDPNQVCCDGECCDKIWTKTTQPEIAETCGSCNNSTGFCANMIIDVESYDKCVNVGVGQGGEHCQCNETMQVVGYIYLCKENWDVSKLLWCAAQGAWCVAECSLSGFDPATCANCLAGIDCCDGPCGVCDFVEECYPYDDALNELQDLVFTSFGC